MCMAAIERVIQKPARAEVKKRRRNRKREWIASVEEDVERYLEGERIRFSQVGLFVLSPMQQGVKDMFLSLGTTYSLDVVPDESEQKITHLVLEANEKMGQRRAVVGELTPGSTLDEQRIRTIYFRRQRAT